MMGQGMLTVAITSWVWAAPCSGHVATLANKNSFVQLPVGTSDPMVCVPEADAPVPTVNWISQQLTNKSDGILPSIAVGSDKHGYWVVRVEQSYKVVPPGVCYQAGTLGELGPASVYTGPAEVPSIAALSQEGVIFELHDGTGRNPIWWFLGRRLTPQTMTWPYGDSYTVEHRPRVALTWVDGGAVIVTVHNDGPHGGRARLSRPDLDRSFRELTHWEGQFRGARGRIRQRSELEPRGRGWPNLRA